ncbi:hypothetical protein [Alkalimarinus sediminis]|uniref:VCBS repeat-containing protein n=1 Tax=Alkalimarinus sediminis TaxID=1632866 RepID=A0A9E8HNS1_9ALTE|nr:hypothetical protein [Alkalimarinus sediminis]UZW73691.1 hypothetical protein NNL22_11650 [Alkalimarinus sediminis]
MRIETSTVQLMANASQASRLEQQQKASLIASSEASLAPPAAPTSERETTYQYSAQDRLHLYSNSRVSRNDEVSNEFTNSRLLNEITQVALSGREATQALTMKNGQPMGPALIGFSGAARIELSRYQFVSEAQNLTFSSQGAIKTEDGREIDFSLYLQLNHRAAYETTESFVLDVQQMKDPLVINFGRDSVSLSDQYFEFDLEGDGEEERVASLASGSGYLVLDKNANGIVDNGSELFGTRTGQGFAELAAFDQDGNLWIDENDKVFSQLQLWVSDASGEKQLKTLNEVGVGAIYLGSAEGRFNLHSSTGAVLGEVKSSGIVLMESGDVRTIQELDLVDLSESKTEGLQAIPLSDEINLTVASESERQQTLEPVVDMGIVAINNALEKLEEIRAQQRAYSDSLLEKRPDTKSPLTELLRKMEEIRLEMLEKQRAKADSFYRQYAQGSS